MALYSGQNLNGADLILADGDVLYGVFSGIRDFIVPVGAVVSVRAFDGTNHGGLHIQAQNIIMAGSITAKGAGYGSGGGGGGTGGQGPRGNAGGPGGVNGLGGAGTRGGEDGENAPDQYRAGKGGKGAGAHGGISGIGRADNWGNTLARSGEFGGYRANPATQWTDLNAAGNPDGQVKSLSGGNGDRTQDTSVMMGSGGAGGGGGRSQNTGQESPDSAANGSGGGGAGSPGGGYIILESSVSMSVTGALITAAADLTGGDGQTGGRGNSSTAGAGGRGGSAAAAGSGYGGIGYISFGSINYDGHGGHHGGGGAGGGICLIQRGDWPIKVSATFDTRGAQGSLPRFTREIYGDGDWNHSMISYNGQHNFGSTKIFARRGEVSGATFLTGWNDKWGQPLIRIGWDAIGGLYAHPAVS